MAAPLRFSFDAMQRGEEMGRESEFIEALRAFADHPAARDLEDDAAVLALGGTNLVLTKDLLAEGVHYLPDDPPADVAWKLMAVNMSDLAAKGAKPLGILLGFSLGDADWDLAFAEGLRAACEAFGAPLLGGDTISLPAAAPRVLSLTALGTAANAAPPRSHVGPGQQLWVSGTIGDAGAGLAMLLGKAAPAPALIERYRRPTPRLALGEALAPHVAAMMDVSDGLLIDANRMADASRTGFTIALDRIPLSTELTQHEGDGEQVRLRAATLGDDYELLFAAEPQAEPTIRAASAAAGVPVTRIGRVDPNSPGLLLTYRDRPVPLPQRLGWEHS